MRSFAIWYLNNKGKSEQVTADVHVNLIESTKREKWYIDFGIKVHDIQDVSKICLFCPFYIRNTEDIHDLVKVMNTRLLKALFNENLTVVEGFAKRRKVSFFSPDEDKKPFLLYELDKNNELELKYICDDDGTGTIITIDTEDILKAAQDSPAKECTQYYFRFRIGIPDMGSEWINHEIEGVAVASCNFTKTEIIDFRLNNIRSIGDNAQDEIHKGNKFKLKSVHLLILKRAKDLLMYPSESPSTRMLEAELWHDYLKLGDGTNINDLVAYHFKKKETVEPISEYNVLARFSSTTIPKRALAFFLVFMVFVEIFCNWLYDNFF